MLNLLFLNCYFTTSFILRNVYRKCAVPRAQNAADVVSVVRISSEARSANLATSIVVSFLSFRLDQSTALQG